MHFTNLQSWQITIKIQNEQLACLAASVAAWFPRGWPPLSLHSWTPGLAFYTFDNNWIVWPSYYCVQTMCSCWPNRSRGERDRRHGTDRRLTHTTLDYPHPCEQQTFTQCWVNVGTDSQTVDQHWPSIGLIGRHLRNTRQVTQSKTVAQSAVPMVCQCLKTLAQHWHSAGWLFRVTVRHRVSPHYLDFLCDN